MDLTMGATYRDKVSGFKGVATGHAKYITGCDQLLLQPPVKESGEFVEGRWFDAHRLEVAGDAIVEIDNSAAQGADIPAPIR